MTVSSSPGTGSTGSSEKTSQLERARGKSTKARQTLDQARRKVDEIDGQLGRNAARTSQDEAVLRAAEAQVKQLKRALKDASKERQRLLTDRKRATGAVDKAQDKVRSTEAKYDRAVLADLIERQKQQDRAGAGSAGSSDGSPVAALPSAEDQAPIPLPAGPAGSAAVASGDSGAAGSAGSVEPEDLGTATARATAARTTAEAAGDGAEPAPPPPSPQRSRRATAPRTTTSGSASTTTSRTRRPQTPRGSATTGSGGETSSGGDPRGPAGEGTDTGAESRQNR